MAETGVEFTMCCEDNDYCFVPSSNSSIVCKRRRRRRIERVVAFSFNSFFSFIFNYICCIFKSVSNPILLAILLPLLVPYNTPFNQLAQAELTIESKLNFSSPVLSTYIGPKPTQLGCVKVTDSAVLLTYDNVPIRSLCASDTSSATKDKQKEMKNLIENNVVFIQDLFYDTLVTGSSCSIEEKYVNLLSFRPAAIVSFIDVTYPFSPGSRSYWRTDLLAAVTDFSDRAMLVEISTSDLSSSDKDIFYNLLKNGSQVTVSCDSKNGFVTVQQSYSWLVLHIVVSLVCAYSLVVASRNLYNFYILYHRGKKQTFHSITCLWLLMFEQSLNLLFVNLSDIGVTSYFSAIDYIYSATLLCGFSLLVSTLLSMVYIEQAACLRELRKPEDVFVKHRQGIIATAVFLVFFDVLLSIIRYVSHDIVLYHRIYMFLCNVAVTSYFFYGVQEYIGNIVNTNGRIKRKKKSAKEMPVDSTWTKLKDKIRQIIFRDSTPQSKKLGKLTGSAAAKAAAMKAAASRPANTNGQRNSTTPLSSNPAKKESVTTTKKESTTAAKKTSTAIASRTSATILALKKKESTTANGNTDTTNASAATSGAQTDTQVIVVPPSSDSPDSPILLVPAVYKKLDRNDPILEKYQRMLKAGLPQGAVENAMIRGEIDPASLFDDPVNKTLPEHRVSFSNRASNSEKRKNGSDSRYPKSPETLGQENRPSGIVAEKQIEIMKLEQPIVTKPSRKRSSMAVGISIAHLQAITKPSLTSTQIKEEIDTATKKRSSLIGTVLEKIRSASSDGGDSSDGETPRHSRNKSSDGDTPRRSRNKSRLGLGMVREESSNGSDRSLISKTPSMNMNDDSALKSLPRIPLSLAEEIKMSSARNLRHVQAPERLIDINNRTLKEKTNELNQFIARTSLWLRFGAFFLFIRTLFLFLALIPGIITTPTGRVIFDWFFLISHVLAAVCQIQSLRPSNKDQQKLDANNTNAIQNSGSSASRHGSMNRPIPSHRRNQSRDSQQVHISIPSTPKNDQNEANAENKQITTLSPAEISLAATSISPDTNHISIPIQVNTNDNQPSTAATTTPAATNQTQGKEETSISQTSAAMSTRIPLMQEPAPETDKPKRETTSQPGRLTVTFAVTAAVPQSPPIGEGIAASRSTVAANRGPSDLPTPADKTISKSSQSSSDSDDENDDANPQDDKTVFASNSARKSNSRKNGSGDDNQRITLSNSLKKIGAVNANLANSISMRLLGSMRKPNDPVTGSSPVSSSQTLANVPSPAVTFTGDSSQIGTQIYHVTTTSTIPGKDDDQSIFTSSMKTSLYGGGVPGTRTSTSSSTVSVRIYGTIAGLPSAIPTIESITGSDNPLFDPDYDADLDNDDDEVKGDVSIFNGGSNPSRGGSASNKGSSTTATTVNNRKTIAVILEDDDDNDEDDE